MTERILVEFNQDIDQRFMGTDMKEYGPFEEGDIVRMPEANFETKLFQTLLEAGAIEPLDA